MLYAWLCLGLSGAEKPNVLTRPSALRQMFVNVKNDMLPSRVPLVFLITPVVLAVGLVLNESRPHAHTKISQVTWTVDIAPIIQTRCARCHTAGGFGPIPLTSYEHARTWAKAIREEVLSGRMPPWQAAHGYGDFINDASLTPLEIELLTSWIDGATPLGAPVPSQPGSSVAPEQEQRILGFDLPETPVSGGATEHFEIGTAQSLDQWITGWEFTPGNRSLVEEATLWIAPATRVGSWTPIDSAINFPSGSAERLPRGARLAVDVRYRKTSDPQTDRSRLTLHLGGRPLREVRHRSFGCGNANIESAVDLLAVRPRAAGAGESIEVVAREPNNAVEPIVVVPRYAPEYSVTYRLRRPVRLPAGTRLTVRSSSAECSADLDFLTRKSGFRGRYDSDLASIRAERPEQ